MSAKIKTEEKLVYEKVDGILVPKMVTVKKEKPLRSILKTISWRIIATGTTFALAMFFFRHDPQATEKATGIAIAEATLKMLFYYLHERAWVNVKWGKRWKRYRWRRAIKLWFINVRRRYRKINKQF